MGLEGPVDLDVRIGGHGSEGTMYRAPTPRASPFAKCVQGKQTARDLRYTRRMVNKSENQKKLFLVDAMAHIYRAFYAPMVRMNAPSGIPTKVPFLFANILRRLIKDYKPEYIGVVF